MKTVWFTEDKALDLDVRPLREQPGDNGWTQRVTDDEYETLMRYAEARSRYLVQRELALAALGLEGA